MRGLTLTIKLNKPVQDVFAFTVEMLEKLKQIIEAEV